MSDEKKPSRKSKIAPIDRPGRKRAYRSPEEREAKKAPQKVQRFITPAMHRVLNNCFNPECSTRADVAALSGVGEATITRWIVEHGPFRAEYERRMMANGDELNDLLAAAIRLSFKFIFEVLRDTKGKYSTDDKFRAAKQIWDVGRPKVESLMLQQVNVNAQPLTVGPPADGVIPSAQRFMDAGATEQQAHAQDAHELSLIMQQMMSGTFSLSPGTAPESGVIDGESSESSESSDGS